MHLFIKTISIFIVFIQVVHPNHTPYIDNHKETVIIYEDDSLKVDFSECFADSDGFIVNIALELHDSLKFHKSSNEFLIVPQPDFFGTVWGKVTGTDDSGDIATDSFVITVIGVNDPPRFISGINDTSITNNEVLNLDLLSSIVDVDNPLTDIILEAEPISGIDFNITDQKISISMITFIGTAKINLIIHDPEGLSDSITFSLYTNKPTPIGQMFVLHFTRTKGKSYNSMLPLYRQPDNHRIMKETYNIHGQKTKVALTPILPGLDSNDSYQCFEFADTLTLLRYCPTSNNTVSNTVSFDHNFNVQDTFVTNHQEGGGYSADVAGNVMFVFRRINDGYLFADLYYLNQQYIRTDTLAFSTNFLHKIGVFLSDTVIHYIWFEDVQTDTVYSKLSATGISLNGQRMFDREDLLPYMPGPGEYTCNYHYNTNILPIPQGGYYIFWSFSNALKMTTGGYGVGYWPNVYIIKLDANLEQIGKTKTLFVNDIPHTKNVILTSSFMGKDIFIAWRNGTDSWDQYRRWRSQLFDTSSFQPVSYLVDDSLPYPENYDYIVMNDSITFRYIIGETIDSVYGMFNIIKRESTPTLKTKFTSRALPKPYFRSCNQHLLISSGTKCFVQLFTLNGRMLGEYNFIDNINVDLREQSGSIIVVKVSEQKHDYNSRSYRTILIP